MGDEQVGAVEHALARQLRWPPRPRQRPAAGAVDRQRRPLRRRIEQRVDGREQAARRFDLVAEAGAHVRLPGQRRGHPLQIGDQIGDVPAGVGLEAGPDGGVVAEPPRDEAVAGRGDAAREQDAGGEQPDGTPGAPQHGGLGRGLGRGVAHRLGIPPAGTGGLLQDTVSRRSSGARAGVTV